MFRIVHEGEVILEIEQHVLSAVLRTARGSGPPTFLADDDGVVELVIEKVPTGGPMRLDQLEAAQIQAIQDRATVGEPVGINTNSINGEEARMMRTRQGVRTDTLGEGLGRNEDPPSLRGFPLRDLTEGRSTPEERTKAIEDFDRDKDSAYDTPSDVGGDGDGTPPDAGTGQTKGSTPPESTGPKSAGKTGKDSGVKL